MGRPTKYSKEKVQEIVDYIRAGLSNKDAAKLAGIGETTFYEWQEKYPEFAESLMEAELTTKKEIINCVIQEAKKSPEIALRYLERRYPAEFSKRRELNITGEPITIVLPEEIVKDDN